MSVAAHLGIDLAEYDARIRTFIPDYEEMLDVAASVIPSRARTIIDLGTGTGALAAKCLERAEGARVIGIDADRDILKAAERRLGARATFIAQSFLHASIPTCDVVAASLALHHVRTKRAKGNLYRRVHDALAPNGRLVTVDCQPAKSRAVAASQFDAWLSHLRRAYTQEEGERLLAAWAHEDVYVPLDEELALMHQAGFATEVLWRRGVFAVVIAGA